MCPRRKQRRDDRASSTARRDRRSAWEDLSRVHACRSFRSGRRACLLLPQEETPPASIFATASEAVCVAGKNQILCEPSGIERVGALLEHTFLAIDSQPVR